MAADMRPTLHEATSADEPAEHFPPDIRSAEARSLYRLIVRFGSGLGDHATRIDQRFVRFEEKLDAFIGGVRLEIASLKDGKVKSVPPVPPARAESPSSIHLLEQAKREVEEKLSERAKQTPGENVDAPPKDVAAMVESALANAFQARENASNAKIIRWQRGLLTAGVVAFVTSLAGAAGLWTWAKAQGHAEGYLEGKTHPATATAPHP